MGLLQWVGRLFGRQSSGKVEVERAWLVELVRQYSISDNRLSPVAESITGETDEMLAMYPRLLKEPTVKAAFLTKIFAVATQDLQVKPASQTPLDRQVADFVKHALTSAAKGGLSGLILEMAIPGLMFGYSVVEKVQAVEQRGQWRNRIVYGAFKSKDQRHGRVQIVVDEFKNVVGIRANTNNSGREFDPDDFIVFSYLSIFQNPLGMSDLRAVYRASTCKEAAIKLRMIMLDKFTGPYLVGKYTTQETQAYLNTALGKARASGYITLPQNAEVEVLDLVQRGTTDFKDAIDDFDKEILIGLHGAFLHVLEGQTTGGRGDTSVHQTTSELMQWYLSELVVHAIRDQVLPWLVDSNFARPDGSSCDLPLVSLGGINPADILADLAIDEKLHVMGVPLSLDDLYERANRRPPESDADKLLPAAAPTVPGVGPGVPALSPFR